MANISVVFIAVIIKIFGRYEKLLYWDKQQQLFISVSDTTALGYPGFIFTDWATPAYVSMDDKIYEVTRMGPLL